VFYILEIYEARTLRKVEILVASSYLEWGPVLREVEEGWVEQAFSKANLVVLECFTTNFSVGLGYISAYRRLAVCFAPVVKYGRTYTAYANLDDRSVAVWEVLVSKLSVASLVQVLGRGVEVANSAITCWLAASG
jgi:hypothetical protein